MDLINQNKLGSNFVWPIKPTHSDPIQNTAIYTKKKKMFLTRNGVLSGGVLGLNTLCRGCSSHTIFVGLLYYGGDKSEKICTDYKV